MNFLHEMGENFMDINKYALFSRIAELKNLTMAAELLGYTQSSASHAVSSLETELGISLFTRSRSGMELTSAGRVLLPSVYGLLQCQEQILQIVNSIRGLEIGSVKVAAFSSVTINWLAQIAGDFHNQYPGIDIEVMDGSYEKIRSWISNGRVDCGFLTDTRISEMTFIPLCKDTLYAVFPKHHPLTQLESVTLEKVSGEPFIVPSGGTLQDICYLAGDFRPQKQRFVNTISDASALALVQNGLGVSIFPGILLKNSQLDAVELRRIENCKYHMLGLASHEKRHASPAVKCFQAFAKNWCQVHPEAMDLTGCLTRQSSPC